MEAKVPKEIVPQSSIGHGVWNVPAMKRRLIVVKNHTLLGELRLGN